MHVNVKYQILYLMYREKVTLSYGTVTLKERPTYFMLSCYINVFSIKVVFIVVALSHFTNCVECNTNEQNPLFELVCIIFDT